MTPSIPKITRAAFVTGARATEFIPQLCLPEIAVAGRSNVGKSSLLQVLLDNKKLVRVSQKPGRTREVNFFTIETDRYAPFVLADLPGYGYAKVPISLKKEWGAFITSYLESREQLVSVLLLVDARREVRGEELDFIQWLTSTGIPAMVVVTKIDKLPKTKWWAVQSKIQKAFDLPQRPVLFSAPKRLGLEDLWRQMRPFLYDQTESPHAHR